MKQCNYRALGMGAVVLLWAVLSAAAWLMPSKALSEAERRPLAQMPVLSADNLLDGKFMKDFEQYSLDQFPLRDRFRTINPCSTIMAFGRRTTTKFGSPMAMRSSRSIPEMRFPSPMPWSVLPTCTTSI